MPMFCTMPMSCLALAYSLIMHKVAVKVGAANSQLALTPVQPAAC